MLNELKEVMGQELIGIRKMTWTKWKYFFKKREIIKRNQTNSGAEKYTNWHETFTRMVQQQIWEGRKKRMRELKIKDNWNYLVWGAERKTGSEGPLRHHQMHQHMHHWSSGRRRKKCRKCIWGNNGQNLPKSVEGHESTLPRSLMN